MFMIQCMSIGTICERGFSLRISSCLFKTAISSKLRGTAVLALSAELLFLELVVDAAVDAACPLD